MHKPISDTAIYLPAMSQLYGQRALMNALHVSNVRPKELNFLDSTSPLFYYPYALYSAGQAAKTEKSAQKGSMLNNRNRNSTVVLADSGGFQIQNGTIPFKGEETTRRILRWMEANGDYSMVLDFPTGGISSGAMVEHRRRLESEGHDLQSMNKTNGLGLDYNACLRQTCINNDLMEQERVPGATNLLNVIQGRNEAESKFWYDAVKHYPFEGWAFAGGHQASFSMVLNRVFEMHADGLLEHTKWLHFLGISTLSAAALLSTLQGCIRKTINPDIQISFDSASPFRGAAMNQIYTGYSIDRFGWKMISKNVAEVDPSYKALIINEWADLQRAPRRIEMPNGIEPEPRNYNVVHTSIGDRLCMANFIKSGVQKNGPGSDANVLLMNHNAQVLITALEAAQAVWASDFIDNVPTAFHNRRVLIEKAFSNGAPPNFLHEAGPYLDAFAHT